MAPGNEWDFFVDLTPNDSSMPDSFNSEEDGPLFLHMAGKLDKRNDKKRGSGTRTFNAAKNPVQSRRMTTTASSSNALNRWGNNALRIDTSGPNLMDRKDASQPQKAGSSLKRMSPSKMLLSPSCPNLSQMAKGASSASSRISRLGAATRDTMYRQTTLSVATSTLFKLRRSGRLVKRGFRFWKSWVERWVVLRARMLSYYEIKTGDDSQINNFENVYKPRGTLELSSGTVVRESTKDGKEFCFEVIPLPPVKEDVPIRLADAEFETSLKRQSSIDRQSSGDGSILSVSRNSSTRSSSPSPDDKASLFSDEKMSPSGPVWYLQASSEQEKRQWMDKIQESIDLIVRCESRPTLTGMGSVHDHYRIGEIIGVGRFGVVRSCKNKRTGFRCAAKIINRKKHLTTDMTRKMVENEIRLLRLMSRLTETKDHPNIIKVHEVYEDSFLIYIVVDILRGGDLFEHVASAPRYSEYEVASILHGALSGLKVLHDVGIIHRDIKPENLLFKASADANVKPIVKIADFGLSGTLRQFERSAKETGRTIVVGTPGYVAPEVISRRFYSPACDVYSLGVVLYLMLVGYPPIAGQQKNLVLRKTIKADWGFIMSDWHSISSSALTLVGSMLALHTEERISLRECLSFQWLLRASKSKMLKNCQDRIKAFVEKRKGNMRHGNLMSIMSTTTPHGTGTLLSTRNQSFASPPSHVVGNPNGGLTRNSMSMNNINSIDRSSKYPTLEPVRENLNRAPEQVKSENTLEAEIAITSEGLVEDEASACLSARLRSAGLVQ
eukprot:g1296.t1